ncbi:rhomboid-like protein [Streptomyces sp. NPDC017993]|uniref:rhomboid-like protein n=1 Tax=Streptomyces sp. NPDC017993 TaxID=3365027 RepID=UPI00378DFEA0
MRRRPRLAAPRTAWTALRTAIRARTRTSDRPPAPASGRPQAPTSTRPAARPLSGAADPPPSWPSAAASALLSGTVAYVRRAPGTHAWLAILLATSAVIHQQAPDFLEGFLQHRSTNIHNLLLSPGRVLLTSALWLDGGGWPRYLVLYQVFHVPAERWLGTKLWLAVLGTAHIGATYLSEGVLALAIDAGAAPRSAVNTLDVGVSYALAGIIAVLTYRLPRPWSHLYAAGILALYAAPLATGHPSFTDIGHFASVLIGLACYPLVRRRPDTWSAATPPAPHPSASPPAPSPPAPPPPL